MASSIDGRSRILSGRAAAWSAAAGLAAFGPLFALFVPIARRLDPLL